MNEIIKKGGHVFLMLLAFYVFVTMLMLVVFSVSYIFTGFFERAYILFYRSAEVTSVSFLIYLPFYLLELWGKK